MSDSNPVFFVKFGEKHNLEKLKHGSIYFSNAKTFIELEKDQKIKGQGDSLEGRIKFTSFKTDFYIPDTDEVVNSFSNILLTLSAQYVDKMPVFCITAGLRENCIEFIDYNNYTVKFNESMKQTVLEHFPKADSALLIINPDRFINNVKSIFYNECSHDFVNYFDTDVITIQMIKFLHGEGKKVDGKTRYTMTTDNAYRLLFCKDLFFKNQQEYRFIANNTIMEKPNELSFNTSSKSYLFSLEEFFNGIIVTNGSVFSNT